MIRRMQTQIQAIALFVAPKWMWKAISYM